MNSTPRYKKNVGAAMIEFAIIAPFALLLIFAVVQIGFLYVGKTTVNHAAFMAARIGAVNNADQGAMKMAAYKVLLPFWQDSTNTNDYTRLQQAYLLGMATEFTRLHVEIVNPSDVSFQDFGIPDGLGHTVIPNDSLQYRDHAIGANSKQNIQDANLLKIRVTYGFELKVPLMASLVKSIMCGINSGPVKAWNSSSPLPQDPTNCLQYYLWGRIPIVSYATVRMQSPARWHK